MEWSYESVQRARNAVGLVLEQVGLDAYLFGVEPADEQWEVRLEYATDTGWASTVLHVDGAILVESLSNPAARTALSRKWGRALRRARRAAPAPAPL